MTNNCNCSDATVCEELPPTIAGSKLLVLNDANCQRTLVPKPGSLLYSDGVGVIYADGSASAPLALPNLTGYEQALNTSIPSILSKFAGGVIAAVTPTSGTDGLVLTSLAGEWLLAPLPAQLCFDPDDVLTECCCPAAFAVWVLDESDPEDPQMCLRSFNFCEDATNIESGSIMSCEPETGCIRKLVGTSGDQVPAWDNDAEIWVPTEISDLIPTPESVLDVANVSWSWLNDLTPPVGAELWNHRLGINNGYTITGSGTIATSVASVTPYSHAVIRINNTGWHQFDFTVSGELDSIGEATFDPNTGSNKMAILFYRNGVQVSAPSVIACPVEAFSTFEDPTYGLHMVWRGSASFALSCTANDTIDISIEYANSVPGVGFGGNYEAGVFVGTYPTPTVDVNLVGTITRIT